MRILIFNWRDLKHSWAGGGEIYIFEQAKRWVKMGHQVTIFCGNDIENDLPETETIDGINIQRQGTRFTVYLWAIWFYFTKFIGKYDIIIDVVNGIPFLTPLFSRMPKLCFVYHVHDKQFFYELPFPLNYAGYAIEKYAFPLIYRKTPIIAISKTTRRQLINYGFLNKNIKIVHCGILKKNIPVFSSITKFSHPTLLYLGRIKKYKRVDMLIQIFPQILKKVPRARLIIAGWGTEASTVTDLIMKSKLRRKINLMGPVTTAEKRVLLSKSWLFVNPSIGEGWSIAVIEANLYGTPAIAFNVTGLSESIQHNITGLLAKNEEDLVSKICLLLSDRKLCNKLGRNAYLKANKYDWDHTAKTSMHYMKKISGNYY